jgi:hypothetical protein
MDSSQPVVGLALMPDLTLLFLPLQAQGKLQDLQAELDKLRKTSKDELTVSCT